MNTILTLETAAEVEKKLLAEQDRRNAIERCKTDLEFFASYALRLRTKSGATEPFVFNAAQKELHARLEEQKAKTGRVRAVVLKARQTGVSSYVAARLFHRTLNNPGIRTLVVAHEKRASANLFGIVRRFVDNMPAEMRPAIGASNAEELIFSQCDSGYIVSVATQDGAGRSATAQHLHGSEVAFWIDLPNQMASLLQVVPDIDGSEVLLESTANSYNDFHALWAKSQAGLNEFQDIFLPWNLDFQYRRPVDPDFEMDAEERQLAEMYSLDNEQIFWRRNKIQSLGSPSYFAQEYPANAVEAFIAPDRENFIPVEWVMRAQRETLAVDPAAPLIIGCDPAGSGVDRTAFAYRRGRVIERVEVCRGLDTMEIAGRIVKIIQEHEPARVYVDSTGMGIGVVDRLLEQGYDRVVQAVNFASKPLEPTTFDEHGKPAGGPANRRAELWSNLKRALQNERVRLPNDPALLADLTAVGYKHDSGGKVLLEAKELMKKRGVPSPDLGDAVALCFAGPGGSLVTPYSRTRPATGQPFRRVAASSWMSS